MSNNLSFTDEQLFAELSPDEGAAISGGVLFTITNELPANTMTFLVGGKTSRLASGETGTYEVPIGTEVKYDSKWGKPKLIASAKLLGSNALYRFYTNANPPVAGSTIRFGPLSGEGSITNDPVNE